LFYGGGDVSIGPGLFYGMSGQPAAVLRDVRPRKSLSKTSTTKRRIEGL